MSEEKIANDIAQDNQNEMKFDILKIDNDIQKNEGYKEDDNIFQFCKEYQPNQVEEDPKIDFPKYIAKIKSSSFQYVGILSKNLKKENYGYNLFDNGDEYFGQWNKDKKEGYGIYYFKEDDKKNKIKQIYIGEFKNNVKSGEGVYFKVDEFDEKNGDPETGICPPLDFTLIVGNFSEDNFTKGIIYSMEGGKRKIYKGKMSKEGKKDDDKAQIFEDNNKAFYGVVKDSVMVEGRIIIKGDEKKKEKDISYYFTKKGNSAIDGDIDFDYEKGKEKDEECIEKLNNYNNIFQNEKIKELFVNAAKIRENLIGPNNFEYMRDLNYDEDIKQILKDQYGKFLYC